MSDLIYLALTLASFAGLALLLGLLDLLDRGGER